MLQHSTIDSDETSKRFIVEGFLSYIKGCSLLALQSRTRRARYADKELYIITSANHTSYM